MALPLNLLEQLPSRVRRGAVEPAGSEAVLPLGLGGLDEVLPDGGIPRGGVVELSVMGGAALSTSVALAACRSAQQQALAQGGQVPWCAFIDPTGTLHGPGVAAAGVQLDRLLVVRPPLEALGRVAVKLAESHAFGVLVVDTIGTVGCSASVALGSWPRLVRRLSVAAAESASVLLLVTDRDAQRALPLPVAMRIELSRPKLDRLAVRITKERRGRISAERTLRWDRVVMKLPTMEPPPASVRQLPARPSPSIQRLHQGQG
jgi:recombination protein RecA